jgi:ABC-type glycerol-3-phosphate transport system substrate-binding protein
MKSNFQIIVTGIFILAIVIGVIVFANAKGRNSAQQIEVVIWGSVDGALFNEFVNKVNLDLDKPLLITYVEKKQEVFDKEFVEALASGAGPDAVILPQDLILKHENKLIPIPYQTLNERDFKNIFIEEAELYLAPQGTIGLPFSVDPLVMYWNRSLFSDAGIPNYPNYWDEFYSLAPKLTKKNNNSTIAQSAVAFGEFRNITHAKDILAMLMMQAGNPLVIRGADRVESVFSEQLNLPESPASAALLFYTEFSNPIKATYSWNRALPESKNAFVAGELATYFGYASEVTEIREKNPNLNFDVAPMPQIRNVNNRLTFGNMLAFSITKATQNSGNTYGVLQTLLGSKALSYWTELTGLPPVRRDLIAERPTDAYRSVFYDSALIAKAWLDPDKDATSAIFQGVVESVLSGKETIHTAVSRADEEIANILTK